MSYSPPPAGFAATGWTADSRLRWTARMGLVAVGGALVALLATAACLTPSPQGLGTHQQLGLPPCTIVEWYGIRCPSCGMTTAWSHVLRGQPLAALRANAGGALLALAAAVCGPWLVGSGLYGRWLIAPPGGSATLAAGLLIAVVTLTQWTLRLSLGW